MNLPNKEKNCLILGGSSEIGIFLAKRLLKEKLNPIITYSSQSGLKKIKDNLNKDINVFKLDLASLNSIYDFLSKINCKISYLVDLSHTHVEKLFASLKDEEIVSYYTTNVINRAIFLKNIVRNMLIQKQGRLVYISSTAAYLPNKGQGIYSSSKLAVEAIYKIIGIEMYKKGISTVILRPGYISAGRAKNFIDKKKSIFPYLLDVTDVVDAILFFLKDNGRVFNAREITLDRGFFAKKDF